MERLRGLFILLVILIAICQYVDMVCVQCGHKIDVTNSRHQRRGNSVWRRRHCPACGALFTTGERVDYGAIWRVRNGGRLEAFSRDKLFLSLYEAVRHRTTALADAAGLADTVINKLGSQVVDGVLESPAIARTVQVALNRFDHAASVAYQAFHAV
jgi:transcriptional repressor NrdR